MNLQELFFVVLASVQVLVVVSLIALTWVYKNHLAKMADVSHHQALANRQHAETTMKLVDRLEVQTTTTTHMALMMSKGVKASLEVAKANLTLANQTKSQVQAMCELAEVSSKHTTDTVETAHVVRNQLLSVNHSAQQEDEPLGSTRQSIRVRRTAVEVGAE